MDQRDHPISEPILLAHRFVDRRPVLVDELRPDGQDFIVSKQQDLGIDFDPLEPGRVRVAGAEPAIAMDVDDPERGLVSSAELVVGLDLHDLAPELARSVEADDAEQREHEEPSNDPPHVAPSRRP